MDLCSLCTTTGWIIAAVNAGSGSAAPPGCSISSRSGSLKARPEAVATAVAKAKKHGLWLGLCAKDGAGLGHLAGAVEAARKARENERRINEEGNRQGRTVPPSVT